jgi:ABC-2 type transport system permease protein
MNKELISVMKEKTIVLAIVIQLLIAAFSSVILVGLMSFYDPESIGQNTNIHLNVGVVGDDGGTFSSLLKEAGLKATAYASAGEATAEMQAGSLDAVIVIPASSSGVDDVCVVDMQLYLPQSDSRATVITMVLKEPLTEYENYLRETNGIHVRYTGVEGRDSTTYEFLYSFILPMLMFFPAFIAGSMIIDSISEEIENKTLDTLLSAPVTLNAVLFGKVAAAVFLAIIQCVLWMLLLSVNRLYIQNPLSVLMMALVISAFVTFGSALISMYFKDRERSQFAYSVLLMTVAGASLVMTPSPVSLMARLAMGDPHVGAFQASMYLVPLLALIVIFYLVSKKLLARSA